ncbi:MAG: 2-phospho-L-lactate transferase [Acidimicrobiia bacterium]
MLVTLAGGVGAARFLRGLVGVVPRSDVVAIGNTGDDDEFHGLHVSPDLDTVTYTLAGAVHPEQGWGLANETFNTMDALERYGRETWFRLGDRDLATHLYRTQRLHDGAPLHQITAEIARSWDIGITLLPMSDDRVRTRVITPTAELRMQEWFVRDRTEPPVVRVEFDGIGSATPAPGVIDAIAAADTIVICPSNPIISIGPILGVPGVRDALRARRERVVGVSPIIAGKPLKGPADRLMSPLGIEVSCVGVAEAYADVCATLVIDSNDAALAPRVAQLGVRPVVTDTVMRDARVAAALARYTLDAVA